MPSLSSSSLHQQLHSEDALEADVGSTTKFASASAIAVVEETGAASVKVSTTVDA